MFFSGAPLGIRTPDLRIRSALLYPAELMALVFITKNIILKNSLGVKGKLVDFQIYFSTFFFGMLLWHGTPV